MQNRRQLVFFAATMAVLLGFLLTLPGFAASTEQVLYSFNPNGPGGIIPYTGLIFDKSGNLYGTATYGGSQGVGTVFELSPGSNGTWTEQALYSFGESRNDGQNPDAGLIFDSSGNLYGTTVYGGTYGAGTVFELMLGTNGMWTEQVLYSFGQGEDGQFPYAQLIFDNSGNLYGTTLQGGTYDDGTVFELMPGTNGVWTEELLHSFKPDGRDGLFPEAGLIFDKNGDLFGTTYEGGTHNDGTAFGMRTRNGEWAEKVLHSFEHNGKDGFAPEAALTLDAAGDLFGTTAEGGTYDDGTVFGLRRTKNGEFVEKVLYSFDHGTAGGSIPYAGLVIDQSGNLYGTTYVGGRYSFGTVFELMPGTNGVWTENVLHSFDPNDQDGLQPTAGVIFDAKGNLYGTTSVGGAYGNGTVFEVVP